MAANYTKSYPLGHDLLWQAIVKLQNVSRYSLHSVVQAALEAD